MNTTPSSPPHATERALVLGGGGSAGNAWVIGVIAGLAEAGLDLTTADLTIGTSSGSTTAAQIAGATPGELYSTTVAAVPPPRPAPGAPEGARAAPRPMADHLKRFRAIIAMSTDAADMRRRMGALTLEEDAGSDGSGSARWRSIVAARLPRPEWPDRTTFITAVDARTGEPVVFDRHSGVDLVDAVAASTSGGTSAYRIGDGRYIDGGYRSNAENADLAAGYGRVLVLSPLSGRSLHPLEWGTHLATQIDALRAGGSRVETVFPDSGAAHLFGANAMDPSLRAPAARAGYDQGRAGAERLSEFWR